MTEGTQGARICDFHIYSILVESYTLWNVRAEKRKKRKERKESPSHQQISAEE